FNLTQKNEIKTLRAEIRFLRAMNYYNLVDLFGKGPFIPETISSDLPKERSRADHFAFVESELNAIENLMLTPKSNEYGRADRAAVWVLLSKLYLNAKVYINVDRSADAAVYAKKVIDAGYTLEPNYRKLFLTDNNQCKNEIIFPIISDGLRTQSYGLTTFLVHASIGGSKMKAADYGVNGGWAGLRAKQNLSNLFNDSLDTRDQLFKDGQTLEVKAIGTFSNGYAVPKFQNVSTTGVKGSDNSGNFIDTDFPLYRLGDVYLMYAEALLRSGGSQSEALNYFNQVRERAYNKSSIGNLSSLNLDQILDERARELHWEAARRTDLIRYGKYTSGSYLWPFKGGPVEGIALDEFRNIFPIPQAELT
ncbi:MAG: RagB/SusD family nutrient uptake outer membrane protein, partial [Ignavibacteria bacterium]|nr:RagB/SusD family nutrient uptake outer membrane protein [Ignavibacteria bacterium]